MEDIMTLIEQSDAGVIVEESTSADLSFDAGKVPTFKNIGWVDLSGLTSKVNVLKVDTDISSDCLLIAITENKKNYPVVVKSNTNFLVIEGSTTDSIDVSVITNTKTNTISSVITKDSCDGYMLHCIYGNGTFDKRITLFKSISDVFIPVVIRTHKNEEPVIIDRTLIDDINEGKVDLELRSFDDKITDNDMVVCSNVNHKISKIASTSENVGVLLNKILDVLVKSNDPKYIDLLRESMFSLTYVNKQPE
jgi:hypothetical protein